MYGMGTMHRTHREKQVISVRAQFIVSLPLNYNQRL